MATPEFDEILETTKRAAAVLRDADVPFLLGGGIATWARGGPRSDHDLDFMVKPEDAERAQEALVEAGMTPDPTPEDWLLKVWDDGVLVDLIFRPASGPITDDVIARGEEREVLSMTMRVMALEDIFATKLLALDETSLDYVSVLEMARAVREQVDWDEVRELTKESPYARAFFTLVEGLGVVSPDSAGRRERVA